MQRKKLIEVALPLEAINAESARRKQKAPKGYPTAIHKWWAQVPIASCRAVLFAQLVDDPSSWPERFPSKETQGAERKRLHDFIAQLVKWENSNNETILNKARWYIARSLAWGRGEEPPPAKNPDAVRNYLLEHAPPVYDPFCGGGSIPLEAQRLGLRAYGSDLNPVAVMITKALVEFPPKFAGLPPVNPESRKKLANGGAWNAKGAQGLAEDVRYYGRWMRDEAKKRIGHLYPDVELPDGSSATVIAWLWAHTVASPNPAARGAHVPLISSFILSTKEGKQAWVEPVLYAGARDGYRFEIRTGNADPAKLEKAKKGTKASRGANFVCVLTGAPITPDYIKAEGMAKRMNARLMAIVAEGTRGRVYVAPDDEHDRIAATAKPRWAPNEPLPYEPRAIWCTLYGLTTFADLFTPRQLVALTTFSDLVLEARANALEDARAAGMASDPTPLAEGGAGANAYADAVAFYAGIVLSRIVHYNTAQCTWLPKDNAVAKGLPQQAIPMTWDFAEGNPFGDSSSEVNQCVKNIADCIETVTPIVPAYVEALPAQSALKRVCNVVVCTDPPYYDNVGYADLSDFFYIWLRRPLREVLPRHFETMLVPKSAELVATPYRFNGSRDEAEEFFLTGMTEAVREMARACTDQDSSANLLRLQAV